MWLVGFFVLAVLTAAISGLFGARRRFSTGRTKWDLGSLSGAYAGIIAPLAGFSVAASVFLANLSRVAETRYFADVMALFLIAFIMLMATAVMFATFRSTVLDPSASTDHAAIHSTLYLLSNLGFYLALSMSWLGLRPLLLSIGLSTLASVFTWILLFSLLAGALRIGAWLHTLLGVPGRASVAIPVVSILGAIAYGFLFAHRPSVLWPPTNPVLSIAVLIFAIGSVAFTFETLMITLHHKVKSHSRLRRVLELLITPYIGLSISAIALLWYAIAFLPYQP